MLRTNFNARQPIFVIFVKDVAEKVCYQTVICYLTCIISVCVFFAVKLRSSNQINLLHTKQQITMKESEMENNVSTGHKGSKKLQP